MEITAATALGRNTWKSLVGASQASMQPPTLTWKVSMQLVVTTHIPEQEWVSLETKKMTAKPMIPELALAQEGGMMTPTLETKHRTLQIMARQAHRSHGVHLGSVMSVCFFFLLAAQGQLNNNELWLSKKKNCYV